MSKALLTEWKTSPDYTMTAVQCHLAFAGAELPKGTGRISQSKDGQLLFHGDRTACCFKIVSNKEQRRLEDFLVRNFINMASVLELQAADDASEKDTFFLHIVFFVKDGAKTKISIFCNQTVVQSLKRYGFFTLGQLKTQLLWPTDDRFRRVCLAYSEGEDFQDSWKGKSDDTAAEEHEGERSEADAENVHHVTFFGRSYQLKVGIYQRDDHPGQEIWLAEQFTMTRRFLPCMRLLHVADFSLDTEEHWSAAAASSLLQKEGTYLSTWKHYADMEGEIQLDKLRRIGRMRYDISTTYDADGYITATVVEGAENLELLEAADDKKKEGDKMFYLSEAPSYMSDEKLDWSGYEKYLKELRKKGKKCSFEIMRIDHQQNKLWLKPLEPSFGEKVDRLYLDDYKVRLQIERRMEARQAIQFGRSANPQLGLIIGGDEDSSDQSVSLVHQDPIVHKPISPFSYSTLKELKDAHREPTATQKEAISMALNTPDIAIIQGPPGTGKTTVITAILKRLNEVLSKDKLVRGRVLVTSLQHDAVYNVINRVELNSLPIIKFGKRYQDKENSRDNVDDESVRLWCDALRERLLARHPMLTESANLHQLTEAYSFYALKPTTQNATDFLDVARQMTVEKRLLERIRTVEERYRPIESREDTDLLAAIRRLWSNPRAFADGGSTHAAELLALLDEKLEQSDEEDAFIRTTLEAASGWAHLHGDEPISEKLRHDLRRCRRLLLARSIPRPRYQIAKLDDDITQLYEDIKQTMEKPEGEEDNILYTLLGQLEYNQEGIEETLKDYMFAYAATAQQSARDEIRQAQGTKRLEYDTVIVDEAARVNPGDLLIPLSQAKRRIILVGDHRQLPHMYDEEVFERLLDQGITFRHEDIQQSMFENLLGTARKLEQKDGIKRFITLDVQYRMHPLLGKFVSDNFYASHDPAEAFRSELGAEHFAQPFTSLPLLWIDVPVRTAADREQRQNLSWMRRRECEIIVQTLYQMMEHMPKDHPFSIGVISFYSSQVNYLKKLIKEQNWNEAQIKVGTVDAYQGMEYDIIFLSIVRATIEPDKIDWKAVDDTQAKGHDRIGRRHYGFLTSENRLCVALSRQKRLLIVVGNAALFSGKFGGRLAEAYVPALKNFYELCEQKGAVLHA